MTTLRRALVLVLAIALAIAARAQTLEVAAAAGGGVGPGGTVALSGLQDGGLSADLRFGIAAPGTDAWSAILRTRISRSATLGLLGAATLELDAAFRTDGRGSAHLAGQGVLGPVSLRVEVGVASADPEAFAVAGLAASAAAPRVHGPRVGVDVVARYRIDRNLLLTAEPAAVLAADGLGLRLRGSLRARRLVADVDGVAAWHVWRAPGGEGLSGAVGVGGAWAPRRAPEWHATVWLGGSRGRLAPGATVRGATTVGGRWTLALDLAAEPFRTDVPPYRAAVEATVDLGAHTAFLAVEAQAPGAEDAAPAAAARAGVRIALP